MDNKKTTNSSSAGKYHHSLQTLKPVRWSNPESVSLKTNLVSSNYTFNPLQNWYWVMFPYLGPILWTMQVSCPLQPLAGWRQWCGACLEISWTWALSTFPLLIRPTPAEKGLSVFLQIYIDVAWMLNFISEKQIMKIGNYKEQEICVVYCMSDFLFHFIFWLDHLNWSCLWLSSWVEKLPNWWVCFWSLPTELCFFHNDSTQC